MIAIQNSEVGFHPRWIKYCTGKNIPFKLVNCYDSNIVRELRDCKALMWHHNHAYPTDKLIAKPLLNAFFHAGVPTFPDFNAYWHFDDKVAQKYLLEALGIRLVQTDVFFSKEDAYHWIKEQSFPKVFKLRGGAGSKNVRLVKNSNEAKKLTDRAFGKGFRQIDSWSQLKEVYRLFSLGKAGYKDFLKALAHLIYPYQIEKSMGREKGYVYFQEFVPNNTYDIRVVVIDQKAFAIKRNARKGDFRASGSGFIEYEKKMFDENLIQLSFHYTDLLKASCVAYDFVFAADEPLLVEISYGFSAKGYDPCPGYWSADMNWHEGAFNPYGWMVDSVLKQIE